MQIVWEIKYKHRFIKTILIYAITLIGKKIITVSQSMTGPPGGSGGEVMEAVCQGHGTNWHVGAIT